MSMERRLLSQQFVDEVVAFDSVFMGHHYHSTMENNSTRAYYRVRQQDSMVDEVFVFDSVNFMGNRYRNTVENINGRRAFGVSPPPPPASSASVQFQDSSIEFTTDQSSSFSSSGECSICLGLLSSGTDDDDSNAIIQLPHPCSHVYHLECITHWLTIRNTCPLCRRIINL